MEQIPYLQLTNKKKNTQLSVCFRYLFSPKLILRHHVTSPVVFSIKVVVILIEVDELFYRLPEYFQFKLPQFYELRMKIRCTNQEKYVLIDEW